MIEIDSLTGLYNREAFCKHAEQCLRDNPGVSFDIVLSDFVNFKHFNERYGIEAGDRLLIKTAQMLSSDNTDHNRHAIYGRYGADRFVSLIPHLDEYGLAVLEHFKPPVQEGDSLPLNSIVVKFGVCSYVDLSAPISVFCDRAYVALQSIKHQYGKTLNIYDSSLDHSVKQHLTIEENMEDSLKNNYFHVYYQPKMCLHSGKICGAEALVRWIHPVLGFMNPGAFIPMFERNGFITSLDLYIWEQVFKDISSWQAEGLPIVPISANASRKDFDTLNLSEVITDFADNYNVDHSLFHLEVTESSYAESPDNVIKHIGNLHRQGFKIELDDFGSGFTSLSFLNDIDLDIIKLDISLLQRDNPQSGRSVLEFAMQMANMLELTTIQEGVETQKNVDRMKELGCDRIQGYFFSKPLPKEDFVKFLKERS